MQTTENDLSALRAEMAHLRKDMAEITETLQEALRDGRREAIGKARHTSERLARDAGRAARDVVHEIEYRPLATALAGFAAIVVLGLLFGTRHH